MFNAMLKKIAPKLCEREMAGDPVMNVIMDSQGQYGVCRVEVLRDGADRFEIR